MKAAKIIFDIFYVGLLRSAIDLASWSSGKRAGL